MGNDYTENDKTFENNITVENNKTLENNLRNKMLRENIKLFPQGDNSILIVVENTISEIVNQKVQQILFDVQKEKIAAVLEIVPAYSSLQVLYNPLVSSYDDLRSKLEAICKGSKSFDLTSCELVTIPVLYGNDVGIDLNYVAEHNGLSAAEVINIHTSVDYLIYMIGFTPGFPYLGGMSEKIATPRLESPRQLIHAGSVGIAGEQTGIYPINSPGGWRIIGRTPLKLFEPNNSSPVLLKAGQYIRFKSINKDEYSQIKEIVERDGYSPVISSISKGADNS